jgi:hypothetical protein
VVVVGECGKSNWAHDFDLLLLSLDRGDKPMKALEGRVNLRTSEEDGATGNTYADPPDQERLLISISQRAFSRTSRCASRLTFRL